MKTSTVTIRVELTLSHPDEFTPEELDDFICNNLVVNNYSEDEKIEVKDQWLTSYD